MKIEFHDPREAVPTSYSFAEISSVNVILGKNGCGKSRLMRALNYARHPIAHIKYITPERGGTLKRDGNVETNMQNDGWIQSVRIKNRFEQFRQTSTSEFNTLETLVLRKIESDKITRADLLFTFENTISEINGLLENVELRRAKGTGFEIISRDDGQIRDAETLSSGEAELISLGIEILSFALASENPACSETDNWLLFDEPDVHLHPDLQQKLMRLLVSAQKNRKFKVLITTHSTAIVSALSDLIDVRIAFMRRGQTEFLFEPVSKSLAVVLPIFGAHPLSNVFNNRPILLVEGEDDERIWQQAVRSSNGGIQVWPCAAGDLQSLNSCEVKARTILQAVYDEASAFSLRDRDENPYPIDDLLPVVRARLNCRASENLLLSDDVLALMKRDWSEFQVLFLSWLKDNSGHPQHSDGIKFQSEGFNRRDADLKPLRNILLAIAGCNKPWEVVVGQAIANLKQKRLEGPDSLVAYLGPKIMKSLDI